MQLMLSSLLAEVGVAGLRVARVHGRRGRSRCRAHDVGRAEPGLLHAVRGDVAAQADADRDAAREVRDARQLPAVEEALQEAVVALGEVRGHVVPRQVGDVRAVVRQDTVAAAPRVERVRRRVLAVDHPEHLREGVGREVLEAAARLPAQCRLQRVVVRRAVVLPVGHVGDRRELPEGVLHRAVERRDLDGVGVRRRQSTLGDHVAVEVVQEVASERADVADLEELLPGQPLAHRQARGRVPRVVDRRLVDRRGNVDPADERERVRLSGACCSSVCRPGSSASTRSPLSTA